MNFHMNDIFTPKTPETMRFIDAYKRAREVLEENGMWVDDAVDSEGNRVLEAFYGEVYNLWKKYEELVAENRKVLKLLQRVTWDAARNLREARELANSEAANEIVYLRGE
jgi:hypothetical protein